MDEVFELDWLKVKAWNVNVVFEIGLPGSCFLNKQGSIATFPSLVGGSYR